MTPPSSSPSSNPIAAATHQATTQTTIRIAHPSSSLEYTDQCRGSPLAIKGRHVPHEKSLPSRKEANTIPKNCPSEDNPRETAAGNPCGGIASVSGDRLEITAITARIPATKRAKIPTITQNPTALTKPEPFPLQKVEVDRRGRHQSSSLRVSCNFQEPLLQGCARRNHLGDVHLVFGKFPADLPFVARGRGDLSSRRRIYRRSSNPPHCKTDWAFVSSVVRTLTCGLLDIPSTGPE